MTTEDIIQMDWQCKSCRTIGPGLTGEDEGLRCSHCGNQRSDEPWLMPDTHKAPVITDPKLIARAKAGEVWPCTFCGHSERAEHTDCSVCGAPKNRAEAAATFRPASATIRPSSPSYTPQSPPASFSRRAFLIALSAVVGVVGAIWLGFWAFGSHTATARVAAVYWERTSTIEERHIKSGVDWSDELREGAFDQTCVIKFRRNRDCNPHKCNPRQESYSCNCKGGDSYACGSDRECTSNNNGSATCRNVTKYCTRPRTCDTCTRTVYATCYEKCPVHGEWCNYKYPLWEVINSKKEAGEDTNPKWPELHPNGSDQRLLQRERYSVRFTNKEREWTLTPKSEVEFKRYPPKSTHKVEYNRAGAFKVLGAHKE